MTQIRKFPYLTPSSERMLVGDWLHIKDGISEPLEALFPAWEPVVSINAYVPVRIDISGILTDCNLDTDAQLRLGAVWNSSGTMLRGRGAMINLDLKGTELEINVGVNVEGIKLAKSIELCVLLILASPGSRAKSFAPRIPGSILLKSKLYEVLLEGQGPRFPIEVLDFAHSSYPNDAAWVLHWDPNNLHQTVLGDVRLYLNAKHEHVVHAVSENKPEYFDLQEAVRFDVARSLIYGALNNKEFLEAPEQYEAGTIGSAVRDLLQFYFPDTPISQIQANSEQPQSFEPKLQEKLRAFWSED